MQFRRPVGATLAARLREPRRMIQVLAGPRQVGKTTLARQVMTDFEGPSHYASADDPTLKDAAWIESQWTRARLLAAEAGEAFLVLDECQKAADWSEVVKKLWDQDTADAISLRVVLLGSSPLLVHRGLNESLAGRFELVRIPHWSFTEMRDAFGTDVDKYVFFGGYPGAAPLINDDNRWRSYILDSLIETTISRDILLMSRVDKPALLRRLFALACDYSGQVLSYQKMLGSLQDAGNTTTLAHYLDLLSGAGMVTGLQKFSGSKVRKRGSSPKLIALNTALVSAMSGRSFEEARADPQIWGRLVETSIGAHLCNGAWGSPFEVAYWRHRNLEIDFVVSRGESVTAIEVTSGRKKGHVPGFDSLGNLRNLHRKLLVGGEGIPVQEFLARPLSVWTQ